MFKGFDKLVEERIRAAQRRGDFRNLPGAGKPLNLEDDHHIPEDLRLPYKILKNAGCLPPEIQLQKDICRTEELLASMTDTTEKYKVMKKLNFMIMKLNTMRDLPAQRDLPQRYHERIVDRLDKGSCSTGKNSKPNRDG